LDGGHVLYSLEPSRQAFAARVFLAALLPLGFVWWGWWAWALAVLILHRGRVAHPRVLQGGPGIGVVRALLAWVLIATFLLTFVPRPIGL
jgi:hypothetical protein